MKAFTSLAVAAGLVALARLSFAQSSFWFPPAVTDPPNATNSNVDLNGDGINGMKYGPIFVSGLNGNDANIGDIYHPLKTIETALCVAQALGGRPVYVDTTATYTTALVPWPNTELYGAYRSFDASGYVWSRSGVTKIIPGTPQVIFAPNVGSKFVLQRMWIQGSAGTNVPPITVYLGDPLGAQITFGLSYIYAGNGKDGSSGSNGTAGANGPNGTGGSAGTTNTLFSTSNGGGGGGGGSAGTRSGGAGGGGGSCLGEFPHDPIPNGGDYGYPGYGIYFGEGGIGGTTGGNYSSGGNGTHGKAGGRGDDGVNGSASNNAFGGDGTSGTNGKDGSGGGGGGGGGAAYGTGTISGGGGGGGGAGGAAGSGGGAGKGGQPSIAILWANTSAGLMTFDSVSLNAGTGGNGGNGGYGGSGGIGGNGAGGAAGGSIWPTVGGNGDRGGDGGDGGYGGGGAGGNGGGSIGLLAASLGSNQLGGTAYYSTAAPGSLGYGGFGGSANGYAPNGTDGIQSDKYAATVLPQITSINGGTYYIASAARIVTGINTPVSFSPAIMTGDGTPGLCALPIYPFGSPRTIYVPQADAFGGQGSRTVYCIPNQGGGAHPYYDEPFQYTVGLWLGANLYPIATCNGWISVCRTATVKVNLGGWTGAALSGYVSAKFVNRTDAELQAPLSIANGTSNTFFIPNDGDVTLQVKDGHWLSQSVAPVVSDGVGNVTYTFNLVNGDVDGDNAVTVFDYNLLSEAFDSGANDANRNPDADLDGDGAVTVYDYNILSANFDLVGD